MATIQDFYEVLRQSGYEPIANLRTTETWQRLAYNGEKRSESSGSYKLKQNPDGSYFAVYGSQKPLKFQNMDIG